MAVCYDYVFTFVTTADFHPYCRKEDREEWERNRELWPRLTNEKQTIIASRGSS